MVSDLLEIAQIDLDRSTEDGREKEEIDKDEECELHVWVCRAVSAFCGMHYDDELREEDGTDARKRK